MPRPARERSRQLPGLTLRPARGGGEASRPPGLPVLLALLRRLLAARLLGLALARLGLGGLGPVGAVGALVGLDVLEVPSRRAPRRASCPCCCGGSSAVPSSILLSRCGIMRDRGGRRASARFSRAASSGSRDWSPPAPGASGRCCSPARSSCRRPCVCCSSWQRKQPGSHRVADVVGVGAPVDVHGGEDVARVDVAAAPGRALDGCRPRRRDDVGVGPAIEVAQRLRDPGAAAVWLGYSTCSSLHRLAPRERERRGRCAASRARRHRSSRGRR